MPAFHIRTRPSAPSKRMTRGKEEKRSCWSKFCGAICLCLCDQSKTERSDSVPPATVLQPEVTDQVQSVPQKSPPRSKFLEPNVQKMVLKKAPPAPHKAQPAPVIQQKLKTVQKAKGVTSAPKMVPTMKQVQPAPKKQPILEGRVIHTTQYVSIKDDKDESVLNTASVSVWNPPSFTTEHTQPDANSYGSMMYMHMNDVARLAIDEYRSGHWCPPLAMTIDTLINVWPIKNESHLHSSLNECSTKGFLVGRNWKRQERLWQWVMQEDGAPIRLRHVEKTLLASNIKPPVQTPEMSPSNVTELSISPYGPCNKCGATVRLYPLTLPDLTVRLIDEIFGKTKDGEKFKSRMEQRAKESKELPLKLVDIAQEMDKIGNRTW